MAHAILMPKPGQMTEECVLVSWHKREGDSVRRGDILFEIESDKSNMDVEAFEDGVLLRRYVEEGQSVPVNSVCAYIGQAGEAVPDKAPDLTASSAGAAVEPVAVAGTAPASATAGAPLPSPAGAGRLRISPRASRAAADLGIDPRTIGGTGPEGRITERDVQTAAAARTVPETVTAPSWSEIVPVRPRAGRLAAAAGIDPRTIAGTGPDGRVTERDVRTALEEATKRAGQGSGAGTAAAAHRPSGSPTSQTEAEPEPRPLSRMRRIIAERLTLSATTVPQFTLTVAVDMTSLLALRNELKASGTALTVTDFIAWATAQTLVEFPDVNSLTDGVTVWPRRRVHLGIAVSLPAGLIVPVVRDADRLSVVELHARAAELVESARRGNLTPDDITGGTFTISNLGMLGVDEFQAIINPGEAAILAVSSVAPTPVAIGDAIAVRQIMKLTLTSDHRLVDGELAARFANGVRRTLQDADGLRAVVTNG